MTAEVSKNKPYLKALLVDPQDYTFDFEEFIKNEVGLDGERRRAGKEFILFLSYTFIFLIKVQIRASSLYADTVHEEHVVLSVMM
jgi:hypothetical protein